MLPARTRVLATLLDNGADFIALDEAAAAAGVVHVPLPLFFTPQQRLHALQAAGADTLVTPQGVERLPFATVALPPGTAKITFTSGTTGTPKGVCLSQAALQAVADGLRTAIAPLDVQRHLNVLPFAVLLENIAGLLAPRREGVAVITPPLAEVGLEGSSRFDPARLDAAVRRHEAHSLILLPQMLRAWVGHLAATGQRAPAALRLVAVGGAAVGAPLVQAARALGLPVAEGYGLSEGGSVQTLNLPGQGTPGSVGRALPHARLRVDADGGIAVAGSLMLGYLGDPSPVPDWWPTGDLGRLDADGQLWIDGRRRHVLITAYGRNVSPEWVETGLRGHPDVLQAVVFGDGQPALSAVLWPTRPGADLQAAVDAANAHLPDYARIGRWTPARAAFDAASGLATANGRPQRAAIAALHAEDLRIEA
ncbi:AMP-binding protein [Piscinibacter sakaiensis]|uniref:Long-chain-fatty-acid--CoA ligase n=1 Tax=Piscinibacter sakaiensis TaxID=1547922 RepID=A0A0K8P2W3_PISS1|nr:AMP-binding protein [Piscinibacter sakaiensis]GAP36976.1 long-chain-fatty-acid--CoA ligase [Piscinibacter sakaiensis]